jgi:hypothetical protein
MGVFFAQSPSRFSLLRKGCRIGLHIVLFEACSAFTHVAAWTLARSPIRDPLTEGFSHFVASMTAPVASGWSGCRVGLAPTGKRRLSRRTPIRDISADFKRPSGRVGPNLPAAASSGGCRRSCRGCWACAKPRGALRKCLFCASVMVERQAAGESERGCYGRQRVFGREFNTRRY